MDDTIQGLPPDAVVTSMTAREVHVRRADNSTEVYQHEGRRRGRLLVRNIPRRADVPTETFTVLPVPPQVGSVSGAASPAPAGKGPSATGAASEV